MSFFRILFQKLKTLSLSSFILFTFFLAIGAFLFFNPFSLKKINTIKNKILENAEEISISNQNSETIKDNKVSKDNKKALFKSENNRNQTSETDQTSKINPISLNSQNSENNKAVLFSKTTLKTACREVQSGRSFKAPAHRVEKLNRLMDQAIDWILTDLEGEQMDLYCLRGEKIIVLNFWATWCAPCIRELPSLSQLAENYKEEIFVLAVSTESEAEVKKFLERSFTGLSPELKIAVVKEEEKLKRFPKDKIPATYIFNKKGLLKIKHLGEKNWSDKNIVQQILN